MIYVMSDLHGCYEEYRKALELIQFSVNDTLYILGDVIDRGEGGLKILSHMMMHDNIIPLIGNHELMAMSLLRKLCTEITEETYGTTLTEEDLMSLKYWCHDGGAVTLSQFQQLERCQQEMFLEYFDEFRLFEEITVNGIAYVLMHAGVRHEAEARCLDDLGIEDFVFETTDALILEKVIVCGHTPTASRKIEIKPGKISVDCGCVFGGNLGLLCLDTFETFYIEGTH